MHLLVGEEGVGAVGKPAEERNSQNISTLSIVSYQKTMSLTFQKFSLSRVLLKGTREVVPLRVADEVGCTMYCVLGVLQCVAGCVAVKMCVAVR